MNTEMARGQQYKPTWPATIIGDINTLSDRAAMGLPEGYAAPLVRLIPQKLTDALRRSADMLCAGLSNERSSLECRLAYGTALSILGDRRLTPLDPPMVAIPSGQAMIGTEPAAVEPIYDAFKRYGVKPSWIAKETPRFQVEIRGFSLGKFPITNGEYLTFASEVEFPELPTSWINGTPEVIHLNRPVYTITPKAALEYIRWLNASTGRRFRLPTEYEWEYAAAGPSGWQFPWGNEATPGLCNTMETGLLSTSPVGMFPASDSFFGVSDMAGNVEEFVGTQYHAYPGGSVVEDDLFKTLGYYQIARGGAYNRFIDLARCQRRHGAYPKSLYAIGFRLAEDV